MNEVQVICTVMSADKHIDPDIPAMIGTSAALGRFPVAHSMVQSAEPGLALSEAKGYFLNPDLCAAGRKQAET